MQKRSPLGSKFVVVGPVVKLLTSGPLVLDFYGWTNIPPVYQVWQLYCLKVLMAAAVTLRMACMGDQEVFEETDARGSKDSPCRSIYLLTFPRDGHEPHMGALGSRDFPPKEEVTSPVGTDIRGPWVRLQATDVLYLCRDIVHMDPACSIISHTPYCLTSCYCVDKLHKRFHYEVDTNFCLHLNSCCNENVDCVTGERWPTVVLCRQCCPFPFGGGN